MIEAVFTFDKKWFNEAYRRRAGEAPQMIITPIIGVIFLVTGIGLSQNRRLVDASILLIVGGIYLSATYILWREYGWWMVKTRRDVNCDLRLGFDEGGLSQDTDHLSSQLAWDWFHGVTLFPDGAMLYHSKRQFTWIPKSAFASEADYRAACDLVKRHVHRVRDRRTG